jgi:hypothetical protein
MIVEMRTAKIPANLANWPQTPEITGRILAYREGEITFAQLVKELSERDYEMPSHYLKHGDVYEISEEADHMEPGTIGELHQARAIGLLSDTELETIMSATLRAHGRDPIRTERGSPVLSVTQVVASCAGYTSRTETRPR